VIVRPPAVGVLTTFATVTANELDPDPNNNSADLETEVQARISPPVMTAANLTVQTVVSGLTTPTGVAFLRANDFLVLEQLTGRVKRVVNGVASIVLDLGVNNFSERGLLGIALHPNFANNGFVYLYWTCAAAGSLGACQGLEVSTDTSVPENVPLRGNRVDRFIWNGASLHFDTNLIQLHSFQQDAGQAPRGNHNGGKIAFGPDGKLYIYIGDNGRRGWMQNLTTAFGPLDCAPFRPVGVRCDDQFGGPEPDNAHLTGVILRLNDNGSTPSDNPFFQVGASDLPPTATAEVIANIHKVFAYGIRNGFGLAFDRLTGQLWESQNGDDANSEINRIEAGFNGGWIQVHGRLENIGQHKDIETSPVYFGLQQIRWPPTLIADSPSEALDRMFKLPGSHYTDPLLTWKYEVAPAGFGFIQGSGLGAEFEGDLIVGGARDFLLDGQLFRLKLTRNRMDLDLSSNPLLNATRIIEDMDKWDITGSEDLLFGKGFGITTDIHTGPNGNLFVVSLTNGAVYEIRKQL
jgi:glucose/arabinose dehydrogenase